MRILILLLTGLFILASGPVDADDVATAVAKEGVKAAFEEFERQMITKYFGDHVQYREEYNQDEEHESHHDNKKSKKKGLPPGIAKKLERGGTLPPGIAKRYLPDDLELELPTPPRGYERTVIGTDVVLVEIDTGKIADIITDAVLGE